MYTNCKKNINNLEAMIMAAGRGKRMGYMTKFLAKPLIKVNNSSTLERNIIKIADSGIRKIIINSSYLHFTINKFVKNLKSKKKLPKIQVSFEKNRLETGGGLKNVAEKFDNNNLLVVNGDSILAGTQRYCPINTLYSNYKESDMDVLLLLSKKNNTYGYKGKGDYSKKSYSVVSKLTTLNYNFSQKYIFTGWQIVNKKILNDIKRKAFSLKKVYDMAEKEGRLYGVVHTGIFFHIGDAKSHAMISKLFRC